MKRRTKRVWLVVGGLAIIAGVVAGTWAMRVANSFRGKGESLAQVWQGITNPRGLFPGVDRLTLLLVGQDYNHDRRGYIYSKNVRSDTIMLLSADLANGKLSAVSIPRDTFARAPDGLSGKINGTYARGGLELLKSTIEERFDVKIDNYVVIKPDAVKEIVDSLGGVEVDPIDSMNYDDNWGGLHVHLEPGRQRIDGQQAVGYVRFREVNRYRIDERNRMIPLRGVKPSKEEGDIRRTARQQLLIRAMIAQANTPGNLWKADKVIDTGFNQVETNLSRTQMLALATIFKGNSGQMDSATLPGEDRKEGGAYYWVLDEERSQATIDWLIKGDEAAGRRIVRVQVWNGTKTKGVARTATELIEDQGYTAQTGGTTKEPSAVTKVIYRKAAFESAARGIANILGASVVEKDPEEAQIWEHEVEVIIGDDRASSLVAKSDNGSHS